MKNRRFQKRHARTIMPVLLSLMAALNASQAMVLCVGHDGHVAIEHAVHSHCACAGQTPDPANSHDSGDPHLADGHRQPCIDIPIPVGGCEEQITPDVSRANTVKAVAMASPRAYPDTDTAFLAGSGPPESPATYDVPLRSIVLQV